MTIRGRILIVESYYDEQEDAAKYRQLQEQIDKIQLDRAQEVLSERSSAREKGGLAAK